MLNERPSMPAAVERAKSGFVYNFMHKLGEPRVLGWISVAFVLIMWEVVVAAAHLNPIYLPRPTHILIALVTMFQTGGLLSDLLATLGRIFGGFAISLVIGTLLGIWMATSARVSAIADNFIAALYPLPKVTLIAADHLAWYRWPFHADDFGARCHLSHRYKYGSRNPTMRFSV